MYMITVWCFVYTMVNCLPNDLLISGKLFDEKYQQSDISTNHSAYNKTNIIVSNAKSRQNATDKLTDALPTINTYDSLSSSKTHKRVKRLHIFRPLFVYRQEQIKRRRIIEERKLRNRLNGVDRVSKQRKCQCCRC